MIGVSASLLFKDNYALVMAAIGLVIGTILYIERKWIFSNIFRQKLGAAIAATVLVLGLFAAGFVQITAPQRKTKAAIRTVTTFLGELKAGRQTTAYNLLSKSSRDSYLHKDFIADQSGGLLKIKDFTIEQVNLNKYDANKARVIISSPFQIFGHANMDMDLVRENSEWRIVLTRKDIVPEPVAPPAEKQTASVKPASLRKSAKQKKKDGAVTSFFKSIF
jgi:hypothetical protein